MYHHVQNFLSLPTGFFSPGLGALASARPTSWFAARCIANHCCECDNFVSNGPQIVQRLYDPGSSSAEFGASHGFAPWVSTVASVWWLSLGASRLLTSEPK